MCACLFAHCVLVLRCPTSASQTTISAGASAVCVCGGGGGGGCGGGGGGGDGGGGGGRVGLFCTCDGNRGARCVVGAASGVRRPRSPSVLAPAAGGVGGGLGRSCPLRRPSVSRSARRSGWPRSRARVFGWQLAPVERDVMLRVVRVRSVSLMQCGTLFVSIAAERISRAVTYQEKSYVQSNTISSQQRQQRSAKRIMKFPLEAKSNAESRVERQTLRVDEKY